MNWRSIFMLLAVAGLLAGCADEQSRTRDYARGVLEAKRELDRAYTNVAPKGLATKEPASEEALVELQNTAREARRDVEALDPPEDLKDEDKRIVAALRKIERGTADIVSGRRAGPDSDLAQKGLEQYVQGSLELEEVLEKLRRED